MTPLPTARLLPLLTFMALLMLGVKGYGFWYDLTYGSAAQAAETAPAAHPPAAAPTTPQPAPATPAPAASTAAPAHGATPTVTPTPAPAASTTPPAAPPAAAAATEPDPDMPSEYSPAEVQVLQTLGLRRAELDKRAAELDQREVLVEAAQQSVEDKVKELQALRTELQTLLHTVDTQQQERIASLVKIYETMKPREAAAILENLEMPVALQVLGDMKETKSAPILAAMDPQKASAMTVEMSRRQQLPEIPQ